MKQKTIQKEVTFTGVGLHLGQESHLTLKPAQANTGVVFVRVDLPNQPRIPAYIDYVHHQMRRTALAIDPQAQIHTPEHLLAACYGRGLDNLIIEIDSPEIPGMDGSSKPFYDHICEAGLEEQDAESKIYRVSIEVEVSEEKSSLKARPQENFTLNYTMDHDLAFLPRQQFTLEINEENFARELAPARTFVLKREAEALQKMGLGKGANTQNTLVIDDDGSVMENELRFENEFIRHKTLDLLGDLFLLGEKIQGYIEAERSGHALNAELVRKLKASR